MARRLWQGAAENGRSKSKKSELATDEGIINLVDFSEYRYGG
jgi:hypothetical protein